MSDDGKEDSPPAPDITFNVKASTENKISVTISGSATVSELKEKLSGDEYSKVPPAQQRLIYSGRVLKDPDRLDTYKIQNGHTVHLVKGSAGASRPQATSSASGTRSTPAVPPTMAAGTGNNPLAGLTGARYAGLAQLPNASMFGPDGGVSQACLFMFVQM
jgi:ubiquilin